jgi:signal transduction histidine kinase
VHLGESVAAGPAAGVFGAMTAESQRAIESMACLGGRAELSVLQAATGESAAVVERQLAPALDEGLLLMESGVQPAVGFRHDRIREAILGGLEPRRRRALQLSMARRMSQVPELFAAAAEQYLEVVDAVDDSAERRVVVALLRRAAEQATLTGDHALVNALLAAALRLVDPGDAGAVAELRGGRHAALFSLGRLEEADEEYRIIEELCPDIVARAEATAVQVRSLSHRTRFAEALDLGLESLGACGITVPIAERLPAVVDQQFDALYRWLEDTDADGDLARPELSDPTLLAASRLIDATLPVVYFVADPARIAWLSLEALRIWIEHGPGPTLVGPAGHAAYHAGPQRGDPAAAYRALKRIVAVGDARGYEPGTSQARHMLAANCCWFEPIENGVRTAHEARKGLIAGDDLAYAGYTYQLAVPYLADCAPSLASFEAEVEGGLDFLRRTGNEQTSQWLDGYRWLAGALRGAGPATGNDALLIERYADNPLPLLYAHLSLGVAAAIFGDQPGLAQHSAAATSLIAAAAGSYATAVIRLLHGLALAERARAATSGDERGDVLSELDDERRWLAERAEDAPDNFLHVLRLLDAERSWAAGDFRAAALAYDAARREAGRRQRPWHRAVIAERAARFSLAHGLEQAGRELLAEARREYLAWGATAKVDQLDWANPTLRPEPDLTAREGRDEPADVARRRGTVTTGTIDMLGILSASQALSSETSIERLHMRVVELLGAMTGATGVHLLLWSDEEPGWRRPAHAGGTVAVDERTAPLSLLRYVQRIGEPLVVGDATVDDRFARDPYFADVSSCSLLAVPILGRSTLRAVLVLENRLIRGAFSSERLEVVRLIAGQLAVSLDNAQLVTALATSRARIVAAGDEARRRIERDLHDGAQQRLVSTIITLRLAREELGDGSGEPVALVDEALENAALALEETRELARGIHPRILSSGGLGPALELMTARSPIPVSLHLRTDVRLPERVEVTAYFVVSEALTNVAKHSDASAVEVTVAAADGRLRLSIGDDGAGGADLAGGSGLVGLRDRVEVLGGTLRVDSPAGGGTRLLAEIPIDGETPWRAD